MYRTKRKFQIFKKQSASAQYFIMKDGESLYLIGQRAATIINVFFDRGRAIPSVYATGDRQTSSRLPNGVPAGAFAKHYQKRTQDTHIFYMISNWVGSTCCVHIFHSIKLIGCAITITYKNQQWQMWEQIARSMRWQCKKRV